MSVEAELFTIATDRGDIHRVTTTSGARDLQPQWSPDGKLIAFVSDQSGREEVWLCDENGGQLRKISDSDTQKGNLSWSPDSKALLYTASDKKLHKFTLENAQTEVLTSGEVVTFGGSAVSGVQWSPDGKWVAYSKSDKTLLPHVYIIPASGGQERRVTGADSYSDMGAHWTPDGKRLVYLSGVDTGNIGGGGRGTAQLWAVTLATEDKDPA